VALDLRSRVDKTRAQYIREYMGNSTRRVLTSGGEAVPDGYCDKWNGSICSQYSDHSPFADRLIKLLRQGGGERFKVLRAADLTFGDMDQRVEDGVLAGNDGDFLFIEPEKK